MFSTKHRAIVKLVSNTSARLLSTAPKASEVLSKWIDQAPSNKLHLQDHVSLSNVRSLVSTIEIPQDGKADDWKKGDLLPPGWTLLYFPPSECTTSSLGPDGCEKTPHHPPLSSGLDERMWVGGSFSFEPDQKSSIRIGQEAECRARVVDIKKKEGKDGRTGYYVTVERLINEVGGQGIVKETRSHIYRPNMTSEQKEMIKQAKAGKVSPRKHEADFSMEFLPTKNMLFRFSAITFNTHQIHWHERYAMGIEGREGLIVHGPLTALLLLNFFRHNLPSEQVHDFVYRNTAPLVVDRRINFCGKWTKQGEECELWVETEDGTVVMTAKGRGWPKQA